MRSVEKTLAFLILLQQHDMKVFSLLMGGKRSFIDFKRLWSTQLGQQPPARSSGCGSNQNDVSWQPPSCAHPGKVWGPWCSHSARRSYRNSCVRSVRDCCSELMHFFSFLSSFDETSTLFCHLLPFTHKPHSLEEPKGTDLRPETHPGREASSFHVYNAQVSCPKSADCTCVCG